MVGWIKSELQEIGQIVFSRRFTTLYIHQQHRTDPVDQHPLQHFVLSDSRFRQSDGFTDDFP